MTTTESRSPEKESPSSAPYLLFMLALSLFAVLSIAARTFFRPSEETASILELADNVICLAFLIDFLVTLARSKNRLRYLYTWGWLDLLSSIPAVDPLRWGRTARIFRIFRLLRAVRATKVLSEFLLQRRAQSAFLSVLLISILLVILGASSILQFETSPDANIRNAEDALWWSIVTITTVGYGDRFPLSSEGRLIAALLMTAGVGLFGTFSGFVASWFLESPERKSAELEAIERLTEEIRELRARLPEPEPPKPDR